MDSCECTFELDRFINDFQDFICTFKELFGPCCLMLISLLPRGFCRYTDCTVNPCRNNTHETDGSKRIKAINVLIRTINRELKCISERYGLRFVNVFSKVIGVGTELDGYGGVLKADGLHPSKKGASLIEEVLLRKL